MKEHWPKIKLVMEYEIGHDRNDDGIIADKQWNTFDLAFVGPNTFVGALYLAALKAAARMADIVGDQPVRQALPRDCRQGEPLDGRQPVERRILRAADSAGRIAQPAIRHRMPGRSAFRPDVGQPGRTGSALSGSIESARR